MHNYLQPLVTLFEQQADAATAVPMTQYMRGKFPFLGLKSPLRKALTKQFLAENGKPQPADLEAIICDLWLLPQREYQYVAMDLLDKTRRHLSPDSVTLLQYLITSKSWWDTVDGLASHAVGYLFAQYPQAQAQTIPIWRTSDDFWLRRTTLLFQLGYKDKTDQALLFSLIEENLASSEFFIQKAIGWILREYSKTAPNVVQKYVAETNLAPLSKREALKWLKRSR